MSVVSAIDLNADLGEGGADDLAILDCVSSVNIACGGHAGDAGSMRTAVQAAVARGVAVGAHPSYADRAHFGRRDMQLAPQALHELLVAQISALATIAASAGTRLRHVKPHGALYNQASRDPALADTVVQAIAAIDRSLFVVGLSGGALTRAARAVGMTALDEVFADRAYTDDGELAPRGLPGALLEGPEAALAQAMRLIEQGQVHTLSGNLIALRADTVCLHGDGPHALALARLLRRTLEQKHIAVRAL
jgi:UPF0271 protein